MNFKAPYANMTCANMSMESIRNKLSSRLRLSRILKNG